MFQATLQRGSGWFDSSENGPNQQNRGRIGREKQNWEHISLLSGIREWFCERCNAFLWEQRHCTRFTVYTGTMRTGIGSRSILYVRAYPHTPGTYRRTSIYTQNLLRIFLTWRKWIKCQQSKVVLNRSITGKRGNERFPIPSTSLLVFSFRPRNPQPPQAELTASKTLALINSRNATRTNHSVRLHQLNGAIKIKVEYYV